jgi:hypothetical protein
MFHEPSASAVMPMAVGSAPQKSLSIDSLLRRIKISATSRTIHVVRVVLSALVDVRPAAAGIAEFPAAYRAGFGGIVVSAVFFVATGVQSLFFSWEFLLKVHFLILLDVLLMLI